MAIAIYPSAGRPGFALVEIDGFSRAQHFHFTIRRQGGDRRFVGPDGRWHPTPQKLSPLDLEHHSGATRFLVGPSVVNTVFEEERVTFEIADADVSEMLVWPALPRSATLRGGPDPFGSSRTPNLDGLQPVAPDTGTGSSRQAGPEEVEVTISSPPDVDSRGRRRWLVPLAAGFLIALVAAGYVFRGKLLPTPPIPVVAPQQSPPLDDETRRLAEDARKLIAERGDVGKLADAGERLLNSVSPDARTVGLAALFSASSRGSTVAQLAFGKAYDPRYVLPGLGRDPNPTIAADQYSEAERGGLSVAGDELRGLCSYLRQRGVGSGGAEQSVPLPCANE